MKAALLACVASALAGTVPIDIQKDLCKDGKIGRGNALYHDLHRANTGDSDFVSEPLADAYYSYFATMYIGSDKQKVIPSIDTGSSDLWVMTNTNPYCQGEDASECIGMVFDPSTSTSFKNTTDPWDIQYLDTTGAFGYLCEDTVELGGVTVHNQKLGVADVANSTQDVFGIGYTNSVATARFNRTSGEFDGVYPNYPVTLKDQGLINTVAYSLYLNTLEAQDGVVLFGGVDHAKYSGTLGLVPVVNLYITSEPIFFNVMINGISVTSGDSSCPLVTGFNHPVVMDSGTTYAILPNSTVSAMADTYKYTWNETTGWYEGNCNEFDFDSFKFSFSGIEVEFAADTLIAPGFGDGKCLLTIQVDEEPANFILGDVFLRSLYVVYDLEHNQLAIAQAKYTDESDIEEIVSTVPRATSAPQYSNTHYISAVTSHNASMCQTKTTTAGNFIWHTNDDYQSTYYYGTSTPSASSSAPTNSTAPAIISAASSSPKSSGYFNGSASATASGSASATASGSASSSSSSGTTITTTVPTPTTFSTLGSTFTVSESTVLTITDCGCTETPSATSGVSSSSSEVAVEAASEIPSASHGPIAVSFVASTTTTEVVSTLVTSCSGPTTISTNGATYTVTDSTVLTITDCPCTLTHTVGRSTPAIASASSSATPSPASESPVASAPASAETASEIPVASAPATIASESPVASAPATIASESPVASAPATPASESPVASAPSTPASEIAVASAPSSAETSPESTASSTPSSSESAPVVASGTTSTTPVLANAAVKNTFGAGILLALGLTLV